MRSLFHCPTRFMLRVAVIVLILTLQFGLLLIISPTPVSACTPGPTRTTESIAERVSATDFIFEGTAITVDPLPTDESYFASYSVTVKIHQYLKGSGPKTVQVSGFSHPLLCPPPVIIAGMRRIFYVSSDEQGELKAHHSIHGEPIDIPNENLIAELKSTIGSDGQTVPLDQESITDSPALTHRVITPTVVPEVPESIGVPASIASPTQSGNYFSKLLRFFYSILRTCCI